MNIQSGDVIRARRMGNRTFGEYTIEIVVTPQFAGIFSAYAHRRHSQRRNKFMSFDAKTVEVIASYRAEST